MITGKGSNCSLCLLLFKEESIINYIKISKNDIANGPGVRVVLWVSGCSHCCKNCHNKDTWDPKTGKIFDEEAEDELFEALGQSYVQGITFSGGDPMFQGNRKEINRLIHRIRKEMPHKDIWIYTGFTWEQLQEDSVCEDTIELADVVVDGKFVQELHSLGLLWRGSSNQRVIDVKKTLRCGVIASYI